VTRGVLAGFTVDPAIRIERTASTTYRQNRTDDKTSVFVDLGATRGGISSLDRRNPPPVSRPSYSGIRALPLLRQVSPRVCTSCSNFYLPVLLQQVEAGSRRSNYPSPCPNTEKFVCEFWANLCHVTQRAKL